MPETLPVVSEETNVAIHDEMAARASACLAAQSVRVSGRETHEEVLNITTASKNERICYLHWRGSCPFCSIPCVACMARRNSALIEPRSSWQPLPHTTLAAVGVETLLNARGHVAALWQPSRSRSDIGRTRPRMARELLGFTHCGVPLKLPAGTNPL
jgi:hypothetical protein